MRELIKILEKNKFRLIRKGKHLVYRDDKGNTFLVPHGRNFKTGKGGGDIKGPYRRRLRKLGINPGKF
jgi:hypothetical protein